MCGANCQIVRKLHFAHIIQKWKGSSNDALEERKILVIGKEGGNLVFFILLTLIATLIAEISSDQNIACYDCQPMVCHKWSVKWSSKILGNHIVDTI